MGLHLECIVYDLENEVYCVSQVVNTTTIILNIPVLQVHVEVSLPVCEFVLLSKMQSYRLPRNESDACHEKGKVPIPVASDC